MNWKMFIITILTCFLSKSGYAENPGNAERYAIGKRLYNLSSARLLPKGEKRFSILGNLRWGVSENWEIGSNLLLALGKTSALPNISIKHKMLTFGRHQTSFVSHSGFWFLEQKQPILSPNGLEEISKSSGNGFGSLHGFMHTYDLQESGSQSLHLGFQQMLLSSDFTLRRGISAPLKSSLWLESYRVSVGFDQHLGSDFALSMLAQTLITRSFQQDSNGSEIRVVNETSMADSLFKETSLSQRTLIVALTSFFNQTL